MLGLIGLLGALVAGVVGDALMSMASKDDNGDDTSAAADPDATETPPDTGDLLDDDDSAPGAKDTDTDSDTTDDPDHDPAEDVPVPRDDRGGETIIGSAADEFILGTAASDWLDGAGGDDTVTGDGDADTLLGGAGNDRLIGTGDDAADALYGGDGDDEMQVGGGDTAWGNAGENTFALADYAPGDPPAIIADYTPELDRIVLMYDADLHPEPMVQTEAIEGTEDVSVLLDGIQIAIVQGAAGLDWNDIELMAA